MHPAKVIPIIGRFGRGVNEKILREDHPRVIFPPSSIQEENSSLPESGPDGIRTRICDLRGVLCSHYTTGPLLLITRFGEKLVVKNVAWTFNTPLEHDSIPLEVDYLMVYSVAGMFFPTLQS